MPFEEGVDFQRARLSEKDGDVFDLSYAAFPNWTARPDAVPLLSPADHTSARGGHGVRRLPVAGVPGAYHLQGLLSRSECAQIVELTEAMGYSGTCLAGAGNMTGKVPPQKVNWVAPKWFVDNLHARCGPHLVALPPVDGGISNGINARFRCYKYPVNDYQLGIHKDRGLYPCR
jgi:hypothetical protein